MTRPRADLWLLVACLALVATGRDPACATDPAVSNVQFIQRTDGSAIVDIIYDVYDADGDSMMISVNVSYDAGMTWKVPCRTLSGDVGPGIVSGNDLQVVWDFGSDDPGFEWENCQVRVNASDLGIDHRTHSPANYGIIDWADHDWTDYTHIERLSRGDLVVLTASFIWGNAEAESINVLGQIKALNPDCVLLAYVPAKNTMLDWENPNSPYPFGHTWWERTYPYWSYTTTGDTLQDWPGKVVINTLDPGCREAIASTIVEYHRASQNKFDGIFWDYFNKWIWIAPGVDVDGDPDLDGDGIPHASDPDELQAWREAQVTLVAAVRDSLGEDFIQFFNGQRTYGDSTFAALSDGVYYELFPTLFFPDPDMATALDPGYAYNLFRTRKWPLTQNGGPFVLLAHIGQNYYMDHNAVLTHLDLGDSYRAVALLTDCYSSWNSHGSHTYGWTENDINLGDPMGPTMIDGGFYARDFEFGRVELIMDNGFYPNPYEYRILVNGTIVEELDIPYHFP